MFFVIFCINYVLNLRFLILFSRLAEVGKLEAPKTSGKYETGQLILHKVFGYRGVILFPWLARVYDRDATNKKESTESSGSTDTSKDNLSNVGKEVKGRTHTFYQVLIDTRDAPYIVSFAAFILRLFTSSLSIEHVLQVYLRNYGVFGILISINKMNMPVVTLNV